MLEIRQTWQSRPWTEGEDQVLKSMREIGASFGVIGAKLGRSRNSCISRADRIRLPKSGRPEAAKSEARTPRPRQAKPRVVAVDIKTGEQLNDLPLDQSENPVQFFDLEWHHCRWPIDGEGVNTLFCGDHIHAEHSYCLRHFKISTARTPKFSKEDEVRRAVQGHINFWRNRGKTLQKVIGPLSDEAA